MAISAFFVWGFTLALIALSHASTCPTCYHTGNPVHPHSGKFTRPLYSNSTYAGIITGTGHNPVLPILTGFAPTKSPSSSAIVSTGQSSSLLHLSSIAPTINPIMTSPSTTKPTNTTPVFATLLTTVSGSTITQVIIPGQSSSGITLVPVPTAILPSSEARSTAIILEGKLKSVESKVNDYKKNRKPDPPIGFLEDTLSFAEDFLKRLKPPSSKSGGCTASLFSIVSCVISDVGSLATKIKDSIDDIGPLLSHLVELTGELGKEDDNKPEPTSTSEQDSSSSVEPSSSCGSVSDVDHVTSLCFNTTIASSTFLTCTPHTQIVSGCDVSAYTTTTTSSSSSSSSVVAPAMTYFYHPAEPTGTEGYAALAQYILSTLNALDRLPIIPTTLQTHATANSTVPSNSGSSVAGSSTPPKDTHPTGAKTTPSPTPESSHPPTMTEKHPSCRLTSTTWSPITKGTTVFTKGAGEVMTACTCDNGFAGDPFPVPYTSYSAAGNITATLVSSSMACRDGMTTYPLSTPTPTPTHSGAVEILLQWNADSDGTHHVAWYAYQFPHSDIENPDAPFPELDACQFDYLTEWNNVTAYNVDESEKEFWIQLSKTKDFAFPSSSGSFDVGIYTGCRYLADPEDYHKPGSLFCQDPHGEQPCLASTRPMTVCKTLGNYMVPRVFCALPPWVL